jgi:dynactin 6
MVFRDECLRVSFMEICRPFIHTGTVVHPKATIFAITGPIVIGANCIIEEAVIIINRYIEPILLVLFHGTYSFSPRFFCTRKKEVMRIGDENLFETGCRKVLPSLNLTTTWTDSTPPLPSQA